MIEHKVILLTTAGIVVGAATGIWATTASSDSAEDLDVREIEKGLADLEKRIERLEKRPPSSSWPSRLPWGLDRPVPRGWQPWEFNGRTYYWIPLRQGFGPGTDPTLRMSETSNQGRR